MATIKTDDVFSIASFDPSKLAESFRDFAEKGAQQSKEAYAKLKSAGEEAGKTYQGKHSYPCQSDAAIGKVQARDFAGLVVPGGFMPDKLRRNARVLQLVRDFDSAGKLVAAICHGGWICSEVLRAA